VKEAREKEAEERKNNTKYSQYRYSIEDEFEKEIKSNTKNFFGKNAIYIETKTKIDSKELGGSIPDGFLFDLSDMDKPNFYLVEVELASHDFYRHIFPQITKFFAFFKSSRNRIKLVEKIFAIVNANNILKKEFKKYLGEREIYKFIKDVIDDSQNILLIIDGEKSELPEIIDTYTDTWGKMVKLLIIRKFSFKDEHIFTLDPEFEKIEYAQDESVEEVKQTDYYSEEFHLDGVQEEIKNTYFSIKDAMLKRNNSLKFNPQKYYISIVHRINVAYFIFRKKKLRIVIMLPEEEIREKIQHHKVKTLSEGVKNFYNGPCAEVIIEDSKNSDEVIKLLQVLTLPNSIEI